MSSTTSCARDECERKLPCAGLVRSDGDRAGIFRYQRTVEQRLAGGRRADNELGVTHIGGGVDPRVESTHLHTRRECGGPPLVPRHNRYPVGRPDGAHRLDVAPGLRSRSEHHEVVDVGGREEIGGRCGDRQGAERREGCSVEERDRAKRGGVCQAESLLEATASQEEP